jgi:hypothetical protein
MWTGTKYRPFYQFAKIILIEDADPKLKPLFHDVPGPQQTALR